ncbi:Retrovirus-related Pol polyprotein from transposon TNT 1-94 [Gossypium australe]|uniref:Retrovirus-related Pol polyprotein from transposon TNT 1-94 n=1 Tax=Gossypium australe TaxID=47621 RepID=A0A5B6X2N6_9ROSI|nr:Retrovirus-related Pol polyprotein from transposon TNT 1-94 [Gossypium australe]
MTRSEKRRKVVAAMGSCVGNSNKYSSCKYCGKQNHPYFRCWNKLDCNLIGHIERLCKEIRNQQLGRAYATIKEEEDQLFVSSCFSLSTACDSWLVDSCCTNRMTCDEKFLKDLDRSLKSKVGIGNGEYLKVKGKGTVTIESCVGTKLISNVLFVPKIDQNLSSVGKLVEKGFKEMFEWRMCLIINYTSNELFRIKMQKKSFSLNPFEEEQVAFKCQVSDC